MDGVQVVVDRDPTDTHRIGNVFDGAPQDECTSLVEHAYRTLLALTRKRRKRLPEFGLDSVDQTIECAMQRRHSHGTNDLALPHERHVGRLTIVGGDDRGTNCINDRFYGSE